MTVAAHTNLIELSPRIREKLHNGEITGDQAEQLEAFLGQVDDLLHHRIILDNAYTRWFQRGEATDEELKHFVRQFSVFSLRFLIAALLRVINAPTLEQARAAKEILMNELGVIYTNDHVAQAPSPASDADKDREGDPELVSTEGTVDGGLYRHRAAHFEWLCSMAKGLGFEFADLGKRHYGRATTLQFCDELARLYGNEDPWIAEGASFAVENWAAAGFWQELEDGLFKIKRERHPDLRLAFFTWHNRVEAQHAGHTMEELEEVYFSPGFSRERFMEGARQVLEAIAMFWDGLEDDRAKRVYR